MKHHPRKARAGFTLIELMAVITIIVLLAGLVVGSMGFVNYRRAKAQAKVQMQLIEKALEDYKLDNGQYPATANSSAGANSSSILFKALYFDGVSDSTKKIYLPELDPETSKQGWTTTPAGGTTKITDPWGNEYRYRTATNASGGANADTQNPDFDLWSVGKDTKTKASAGDSPSHQDNKDDLRNF